MSLCEQCVNNALKDQGYVQNFVKPVNIANNIGWLHKTARVRETKKKRKYAFLEDRFLSVPVAIETWGVYRAEAGNVIQALMERFKLDTGEVRSAFFLKQRISLAVRPGNAAAIFGSLPAGKGFSENYNL